MLTDAASVHRRYELGRPDAAFLPICVINDADDKWRKRLCRYSCESMNFYIGCVTCSRILPVSVFWVLQGSGETPLKCGVIYDIDFVAKFRENTTVKNENRSTFVKHNDDGVSRRDDVYELRSHKKRCGRWCHMIDRRPALMIGL